MSREPVRRRDVVRALWMSGAAAAVRPAWSEALSALAHEHARASRSAVPVAAEWTPRVLDAHQNETVIALTEAIIPETDTPGAREALVNRFVDHVLAEADPGDRDAFLGGLEGLDERCRERAGAPFVACTVAQQTAALEDIGREEPGSDAERARAEFFRAVKAMTIEGYYSSEIGLRQELGDDGTLALAEFTGCEHPEHGAPPSRPTT